MRRSDRRQARDELLSVIRGVRRRWRLRLALRGLAAAAATALAAALIAGLLPASFGGSAGAVTAVRVAAGLAVAVVAFLFLVRPLLRRVSDQAVALYLEEHEPSLEAAVLSALEDEGPGVSDALLVRTVETAVARAHAVDDGRWVERGGMIRVAVALVAVVIAGALTGFLVPGSAWRGASLLLNGPRPAEAAGAVAIMVEPGHATVSRGADAPVSARLHGFDAGLVELAVRAPGDTAFERLPMAAAPDGSFGYLLFDLAEDTDYFVEAGGVRSDVFRLTVAELPYVDRLDLELVYPRYTGLPARTIDDGGDVTALRGTTVRLRVTPTVPVEGGGVVVDGGDAAPLTLDSAGALTGSFTVRADGYYRIVLQAPGGGAVDASPRYVVDALSDGPPIVSFTEPGRDERATSIDEVFVEARAEDDYGVGDLTLHYAVNGGEERTERLYGGAGNLAEVSAGHTFYLEEHALEPGDLVAYWATASDNDAVEGGKPATTDIYFIQIRPFRRDYTRGEQSGMPQGGGMERGEDGDLSERQRQIIAATFNLVRDRDDYSDADWRENLNTLALSQERLRDQTETLAQRMVARRVTGDSLFARIAELLPRAAAHMDTAAGVLRRLEPDHALPPEQRALQYLQRAEAVFREVQVSLGQQQGGGGGGSPNAEDLADLFELEMDKLQDQYESVSTSPQARDSASAEVDEAAERLEELARRQQRETERRRLEAAQGRGTAGGQAQRELAEQVEEEARRLERLSRQQRRPELEEAARRLEEAAGSMRRAASGQGGEGAEQGERAAEELRDARRLLERSRSNELERRAGDAGRRARELGREQESIEREVRELLDEPTGAAREERARRLEERKAEQQSEVESLESELRDLSNDAAGSEPDAARRLRDAAGAMSETRLRDKIDFSRQLLRQGAPEEYVRQLEEQIGEDVDELADRLDGIEQAFQGEEREDEGERALEEARDLARALESMRQRTGELREQASGNPSGGGGFGPRASRQYRDEAERRLQDAEELRDRLRGQGLDTGDIDDVIRGLRRMTGDEAYADAEELAALQRALADSAKRLELMVRVSVVGEERLRLFLSGDAPVPPEYRELVEAYYRSLSEGDQRP